MFNVFACMYTMSSVKYDLFGMMSLKHPCCNLVPTPLYMWLPF